MAVFVTSKSQARRHGVYAIERTSPASITATGTGTVALVEAFPWGPSQSLQFAPDLASQTDMFAPPGFDHTGSGYLSTIRKSFARLGIIRVLGATATAASALLVTTATTNVTVTLKYPGAPGNAVTFTIANASDGNTNHFDLSVSISGNSGVTTDTIKNINVSGTGADALPSVSDLAKLKLVGTVVKGTAGRPPNASGSFSGGTDGAVALADWAGTAGLADKGIALLEGDKSIDILIVGDPGNTLRATVNAAAVAHADLMTDRMAFINGPSGQTQAQAKADKAAYNSIRAAYFDVWPYINDDVDGTKRLVPPAAFAASLASLLPPSTSIAAKAESVQSMLGGIVDLEANRGDLAADSTDNGICTLQREDGGGWTFESAKNTAYNADPARGSIKRTRMGHYIARSVVKSLRPYVDSPNVTENRQDEFDAVSGFLSQLKKNAAFANQLIHIVDYSMADPTAMNSQADIDGGNFTIGADIKISSDQEKIFFFMNYGETVKTGVTL